MADPNRDLPPELSARLARPTVRLSGPIDGAAAAAFLDQVLPVLDVPGSIVVEHGRGQAVNAGKGDVEIGEDSRLRAFDHVPPKTWEVTGTGAAGVHRW